MDRKFKLDDKIVTNQELQQELNQNYIPFQQSAKAAIILNEIGRLGSDFIFPCGRTLNNQLVLIAQGCQLNQSVYQTRGYQFIILLKNKQKQLQKVGATILFINTNCDNSSYTAFKTMLACLPHKYLRLITSIVLLHYNFSQKYIDWFNSTEIMKYIKSITHHAARIKNLIQFGIDLKQIMDILPKSCLQFENLKPIQTKKLLIQEKPLNFEGMSLLSMSQNIGIPAPIMVLVRWFQDRPQQFITSGLFRKVAAIDQLKTFQNDLVLKNYDKVQNVSSCHVICSMLKKILWKSADSVFSMQLYQKCIDTMRYIKQKIICQVEFEKVTNLRQKTNSLSFLIFQKSCQQI